MNFIISTEQTGLTSLSCEVSRWFCSVSCPIRRLFSLSDCLWLTSVCWRMFLRPEMSVCSSDTFRSYSSSTPSSRLRRWYFSCSSSCITNNQWWDCSAQQCDQTQNNECSPLKHFNRYNPRLTNLVIYLSFPVPEI